MASNDSNYRELVASIISDSLRLPPEKRASFIRSECSHNAQLEEEVYSYLARLVESGASDPMLAQVGIDSDEDIREAMELVSRSEEAESIVNSIPSVGFGNVLMGRNLGGYEILEIVGRGGMGVVYKGRDTALDRQVALKILHPTLTENEGFVQRFKSEARALGRLSHPNIVNIFAFRSYEGWLYIVMEFVEGGTLNELMDRRKKVSLHETIEITKQALLALDKAHNEHIIHRDIKPHNILLTKESAVKVTDFGLAKILQDDIQSMLNTKVGSIGGTLFYMPPEQLMGLNYVDHRGDLYSLGMTMYQMLAGQLPFDTSISLGKLCTTIEKGAFPSVDLFQPDLRPEVSHLIKKALEPDPEHRFQNAMEMYTALVELEKEYGIGVYIPKTFLVEKSASGKAAVPHEKEALGDEEKKKTKKGLWTSLRPSNGIAKMRLPGIVALIGVLTIIGVLSTKMFTAPIDVPVASSDSLSISLQQETVNQGQSEDSSLTASKENANKERISTAKTEASKASVAIGKQESKDSQTLESPNNVREEKPQITSVRYFSAQIRSDPGQAKVFRNGLLLGETPLSIDTLQGISYSFSIEKKGYASQSITFDPSQGSIQPVRLNPLYGGVKITARPYGNIYINGKLEEKDAIRPVTRRLQVGTYLIALRHSGYPYWDKTIEVHPDQVNELFWDFEDKNREIITATITSSPRFARIFVNGIPTDKHTPTEVRFYPGDYSISVELDGYKMNNGRQEIRVAEVENQSIDFELVPAFE